MAKSICNILQIQVRFPFPDGELIRSDPDFLDYRFFLLLAHFLRMMTAYSLGGFNRAGVQTKNAPPDVPSKSLRQARARRGTRDGDSQLHRAGQQGERGVPRALPRVARVPLLRRYQKRGGEQHQALHLLSTGNLDCKREADTEGRRPCAHRAEKRITRPKKPVSYTHLRAHETRHDLV